MTIPVTTRPFGMRQIVLTPLDQVTGVPVTANSVALDISQKMTWTSSEEFVILRGDDKEQTRRGKGGTATWAMSQGALKLNALKIIDGGTVTASGVTPAAKNSMRKLVTNPRQWFMAEGRAINDNGGDTHVVLFRCLATGDIKGEFADGAFWVTDLSGEALPSIDPATVDALYDIIVNETAVPIVANG